MKLDSFSFFFDTIVNRSRSYSMMMMEMDVRMTNRFEWLNEWWCKIDLLLLFLATTTTRNNITKNLGYNLIEYWRKNNKTKTEKKLSTLSSNRLSVNQLDESIGLNKYWLMEVEKNYNMLIIIHLRHRIFFSLRNNRFNRL